MKTIKKRLLIWAAVIALILMIPLTAMQFTDHVNWDLLDFIIMGSALFGIGFAYELLARKSVKTVYRLAVGIALIGVFLLFWVNGAVGIIGSEGQDANLLYGAVFVVGFVGAFISRFKAKGMSITLFTAALVQMLVPVMALIIWPLSNTSWTPSILGVFLISAFFACLFIISALLFRKADLLD